MKTIAFPLLYIFVLIFGVFNSFICGASDNSEGLRVGSELDFPPYASQDKNGEPVGFSIDLIRAVAEAMGVSLKISTGTWDSVWQELVTKELDVLPIVAQSPERKKLVDFSLPHTETYDAFFVKKGNPNIESIAAARSMEIVAMRSDAAHHELLAHNFEKNLTLVDTIPDGLALIASGKHDAFLCSKLIGTLLIKEKGIKGLSIGPPIQDYKRIFSFAVKKGNAELLEKLNQGLLIVKTNGDYERIYDKWLLVADPWRKVRKLIFPAIIALVAIILVAAVWVASLQRIVKNRNIEITKRKGTEEKLRESEERFRKLFESSPLPTFVWNVKDGQFFLKEINNAADILTYGKGVEFLGISADKIYPDRPDILKQFEDCITEKKNIVINTEYLSRGTGLKRQIIFTFVYISNEILMLHAEDITERKLAEDNLKDNLSFLKTLIETIPTPLFCKNAKGEYSTVNRAFEEFYGKNREEIIGKTVYDLGPKHIADKYYEKDQELFQSQGAQVYEWKVITAAGEPREVVFSKASYTDSKGKTIGLIGTISDITERKKAEQFLIEGRSKLKGALESMTDAVFISDAAGNFVEFNEAFVVFHRLRSKEECFRALPDWPSLINVYSDDGNLLPLDMWVVSKALRGEQGVHEVYKLERRDTGETWFGSYNFAPIYNNEGDITGSVVVAHDITEKLQIQAQLNQAQKMEAIGTLAGGIAHDFNNILGAILGYAEMVQDDCPPGSTMRNDIDRVVKAAHRAKELVKQILAFSRQTVSDEQVLQPALIIKEAMKMLRASLPRTIDIQQDIDPEAGLILADPTQIHQIITNLCTNAFHAMEETGGILNISMKNKELAHADLVNEPHVQPGHFVEISVGDTGSGIAPEIMDRIFDPFFTTKEVGKGTGMGLAIIHGIAKKSGGFISCKSSPGEGTAFHVYLPVHVGTAPLEDQTTPVELIQAGTEHILFIDDEEMLAEMSKAMLERLGYRVTVETNSLEALKIMQNQPNRFDLVITDQTMPGMTGSDLARRMLQIRPGLPIILCTGFSNMISEEKARMYGIKGFAMKPLAMKDIAALIREVLDGENNLS